MSASDVARAGLQEVAGPAVTRTPIIRWSIRLRGDQICGRFIPLGRRRPHTLAQPSTSHRDTVGDPALPGGQTAVSHHSDTEVDRRRFTTDRDWFQCVPGGAGSARDRNSPFETDRIDSTATPHGTTRADLLCAASTTVIYSPPQGHAHCWHRRRRVRQHAQRGARTDQIGCRDVRTQ